MLLRCRDRGSALKVGSFSTLALLLAITAVTLPAALGGSARAATAYTCAGPQQYLLNNWDGGAVDNGGTDPTFSTPGGQPYCLISISDYHWNGGIGAVPGTIALISQAGTVGPYQATGSSGEDNAPNVNWTATPPPSSQPVIIQGTYRCHDSDPTTWSQNPGPGPDGSDGKGFCRVLAQPAQAMGSGSGAPSALIGGLASLNAALQTAIDTASSSGSGDFAHHLKTVEKVHAQARDIAEMKTKLIDSNYELNTPYAGLNYAYVYGQLDCVDKYLAKASRLIQSAQDTVHRFEQQETFVSQIDPDLEAIHNAYGDSYRCLKDLRERTIEAGRTDQNTKLLDALDGLIVAQREASNALPSRSPEVARAKARLAAALTRTQKVAEDKHTLVLDVFFTAPVYGVPFDTQYDAFECIDARLRDVRAEGASGLGAIDSNLRAAKKCKDTLEAALKTTPPPSSR